MNKETGEWNGLMGELLAQKADLAIADLTINSQRNDAVDFSMPFMRLGENIGVCSLDIEHFNFQEFLFSTKLLKNSPQLCLPSLILSQELSGSPSVSPTSWSP